MAVTTSPRFYVYVCGALERCALVLVYALLERERCLVLSRFFPRLSHSLAVVLELLGCAARQDVEPSAVLNLQRRIHHTLCWWCYFSALFFFFFTTVWKCVFTDRERSIFFSKRIRVESELHDGFELFGRLTNLIGELLDFRFDSSGLLVFEFLDEFFFFSVSLKRNENNFIIDVSTRLYKESYLD